MKKRDVAGTDPQNRSNPKARARNAPWLIGIFALGLLVRLAVVQQLRNTVFATSLVGDGHFYDHWARQLIGGDWIGHDPNFLSPGYAYFLAIVYSLFGADWSMLRIVHALLGAITCVLIADTSMRLFDSRRAGIVAGVLTALYAPLVWLETTIHKTALEICLMAAFLAIVARLQNRRSKVALAFCGAVTAGLTLTRENAVVLVPVTMLWLFFQFRKEALAERLRWIGAFALGFVVVLSPFVLRNKYVLDEWSLTYNFGMNFYIGNNEHADGLFEPLRPGHGRPELESVDTIEVAEADVQRNLRPFEVSRYWFDKTCHEIAQDPLRWVRLLARKWMLVWNADEPMDTEAFQAYADESFVLAILGRVFRFGFLVPLAALGLFITRRDAKKLWIFYVAILSLALSITLFFVFARIRISLAVFLVPFAAAAATFFVETWKKSGATEKTQMALVVLVAAVFANWPIATSSGDPRAATYASYGVAFLDDGHPEKAIPLFRKALDFDPNGPVNHNDLAIALKKTGDIDRAITEFRGAIALDPQYADAHLNLSTTLAANGDLPGAFIACNDALRLQPAFPLASSHLGYLLYRGGDVPGAIAAWKTAVAQSPDDWKTQSNLAAALAQRGEIDAAIAAYQQVLRVEPGQPEATRNLEKLRRQKQGK